MSTRGYLTLLGLGISFFCFQACSIAPILTTDTRVPVSRSSPLTHRHSRLATTDPSKALPNYREDDALPATDGEEALHFRQLRMQDERGVIPPDGLEKARQHVIEMRRAQQLRLIEQEKNGIRPEPGTEAAGVEPDSWTWLGPGNGGGRVRSILVHPTLTNTMWVGGIGGGIWRTNNGGSTWFPVDDFMANLAVTCLAMNPANNTIMFAGTGELVPGSQGFRGAGIFRSTDGGGTWQQLASTRNDSFYYVDRLAISADGSTVLAATGSGIWRSSDGGSSWGAAAVSASQAMDVRFCPASSTNAVAGEFGTARYSSNGGQTWTAATFCPAVTSGGRIELATSAAAPSVVYASVNQNNGEVYRSNDNGHTYVRINTGANYLQAVAGFNQGSYTNAIWVSPLDSNLIVVGGVDLWRGTYAPGSPFSCANPGSLALNKISDWSNSASAHADQHGILAHPSFNNTTNKIVFFTNDGGVYRTNDVTAASPSWTNLNNGLGITQFYSAAGNASSGVIIAGAQDNGTQRFTGNPSTWSSMFVGDGGYCVSDPTDSSYFYGEYVFLQIKRSSNGGASAVDIDRADPVNFLSDSRNSATSLFIAPMQLDPLDSNKLYGGGAKLWRCSNAKAAVPAWSGLTVTGNTDLISAIGMSSFNSSLILVGNKSGHVFRTYNGTDATPTWTEISTGLPNGRFVTRLVLDPNHSNYWYYATLGGFNSDNVYRSSDSGATWTSVTGSGNTALPAAPLYAFAIHPSNSNLLYAGGEMGLFTSQDGGNTWEPTQAGPANVAVDDLFWLAGDLIAATHGRGLYRASGGIYVDRNNCVNGNGTFDHPFCTVGQGVAAASSYRALWIRSANYNEQLTINRRVELRSLGGAVTIGRP